MKKVIIKKEVVEKKKSKKVSKKVEKISIDQAIRMFKAAFPEKAVFMEDAEAVKIFIKKRLDSSEATKKQFFDILKRY